jgi:DNA-binding response OmpR family regulator
MVHILIVDSEPRALRTTARVLEHAGFKVSTAFSGQQALDMLSKESRDALVLDIIMPGLTGLEVCRRIRSDPFLFHMPIIFLTAKGRPVDIAEGLDAGGDDYITKPFEVVELPAHIRALLRRVPADRGEAAGSVLRAGGLELPLDQFEVQVNDQSAPLTSVEHRLLYYLILHAWHPLSIEQLLQDVWQYPPGTGDPRLVYTHIANLRGKIEVEPSEPQTLLNVRGRGYMVRE